jgi:hypothetical protein
MLFAVSGVRTRQEGTAPTHTAESGREKKRKERCEISTVYGSGMGIADL